MALFIHDLIIVVVTSQARLLTTIFFTKHSRLRMSLKSSANCLLVLYNICICEYFPGCNKAVNLLIIFPEKVEGRKRLLPLLLGILRRIPAVGLSHRRLFMQLKYMT